MRAFWSSRFPLIDPDTYLCVQLRKAKTYHAGVHPSGRDIDFIRCLRNSGAEVVSIEVYTHALDIVSRSELQ